VRYKTSDSGLRAHKRHTSQIVEPGQTNFDSQVGSAIENAGHLRSKFRKSVKPTAAPSIFDMISSGMKNQFNLTNPENGIKGYNMPDPNLEDWNHEATHV